jgi:alpha-N-arabinofuranosidase
VLVSVPTTVLGAEARLTINAGEGEETISRNIYGHFAEHLGACIYGGFWVGEDSGIPNTRGIRNDVVEALKAIQIPVLRWPGGCFADEYHWMDGIGPRDQRPKMINTHWGMVTETNAFGTHEFLDLCEQLGCEAYVAGNVGSGTAEEMQDWVEYMTSDADSEMANLRGQNGREEPWRVAYFGVGNENWGCGGRMTPEYYADVYKRYQTYVRDYGENEVFKVACGPSGDNYEWMEVLMREAGGRRGRMDGIAPHYYCGSGEETESATDFTEIDWFGQLERALRLDEILTRQEEIMDEYDPRGRVAIIFDEWGAWHDTEPGTNPRFLYQQNSLRDAMVAGLSLNIFNNHCERVKMANIAQTVNVLQAMILADGPNMLLTPTYHVYRLYTVHHDATLLPTELDCADYEFQGEGIPSMNVSASRDSNGVIHVSLVNIDPHNAMQVEAELDGASASSISGQILTAGEITAHNTFETINVEPAPYNAARVTDDGFAAEVPAKSIVVLAIR